MKLSHVIVAIVFFLLGAMSVYVGIERPCQGVNLKAASSGTSIGFAFGVGHNTATGGVNVTTGKKPSSTASSAPKMTFRIEQAVNRHGSDYRDFEMAAKDGFELCQKACADDAKCLAFTFVNAGVQGTAPHCWLKNTVPPAYPDTTCVSGVKD